MTREEIRGYLGGDWSLTVGLMRDALDSDVALLKSVNGGMLASSGKMLRPTISLLLARAMGEVNDDTRRYAAATELLHNATLMHDDVADQSSQRRGRPTLGSVFGPTAAVLVGDFWLARAVELAANSQRFPQVVKIFSKSLTDLAEGEMLQMEKAGSCDTSEDDYLRIITCKTASLFRAAGLCAACSVDAPEEMTAAAREFSFCYGIAFQIKDDILDYTGTDELGKPLGVDLKEKKITLPMLGALATLDFDAQVELRQKISQIDEHPGYCAELRDFVIAAGGIGYAAARLETYISRAIDALSVLPDSPAKDYLVGIARQNALRRI